MTKKCIGCGALFQSDDPNKEGYVDSCMLKKALICRRCFRIKNYGDYQIINKSESDYRKIFDEVKKEKKLVLYLCDILNIDNDISELKGFNGSVILVITKVDLLPKSVKEKKLCDYIKKNYDLNVLNVIFISSNKNYNIDLLMKTILKNKVGNEIYLVGNTNAGKSSLINCLIKSYSDGESFVTTSIIPATTIDVIKIKLNDDITLIDTPGIIRKDNFLYNEKVNVIKEISPKSEIKPRTYQMKPNQSIIIGNYARIDYLSDQKNSFTIYLSNAIKVRRINVNTSDYLKNLKVSNFNTKPRNDIVISGLCFCKITCAAKLKVYTKEKVSVYKRDNLI